MAKRIGLCLFATVITTCMLLVWTQGLANAKEVVNLVARVTAYSHIEMGNDITASGKKVKEGYVALSRDIELEYGLKFGDKIKIAGLGTFEFQDRMNKKKSKVGLHWIGKGKNQARPNKQYLAWLVVITAIIYYSLCQMKPSQKNTKHNFFI